jgi:hypothetical protein
VLRKPNARQHAGSVGGRERRDGTGANSVTVPCKSGALRDGPQPPFPRRCSALELYRFLEPAFRRLKQLLKLGCLPDQAPELARTWILAKLFLRRCWRPASERSNVFPWATVSKPCKSPHRELRPSVWQWTAVLIHSLRQALCSSPELFALIQATAVGDLRRVLDDGPACGVAQPTRLHDLLKHWILG